MGFMSSFVSLDSIANAAAEAGVCRVGVEGGQCERDKNKVGGGRAYNVEAVALCSTLA